MERDSRLQALCTVVDSGVHCRRMLEYIIPITTTSLPSTTYKTYIPDFFCGVLIPWNLFISIRLSAGHVHWGVAHVQFVVYILLNMSHSLHQSRHFLVACHIKHPHLITSVLPNVTQGEATQQPMQTPTPSKNSPQPTANQPYQVSESAPPHRQRNFP